MKVVILAGGLGTRLGEETVNIPKPMVEIGGRPILWHIMKIYSSFGFNEFVVALGYKAEVVKRYFMNYHLITSDCTVDVGAGTMHLLDSPQQKRDDWVIHLIDTGLNTQTGGRLKRLEPLLRDEPFMLTYGDGVSNVHIPSLIERHHQAGRMATITAVRPPARFGGVLFDGNMVSEFTEKPQAGEGWVNGGFMVMTPDIFQFIDGDDDPLEVKLLETLANNRQLAAYKHDDFWQCMDTVRDKQFLERLWNSPNPPWRKW
ncbi:glucose-1-phosphate cytidylyltransferase [Magnetospirillum sp. 15-1]|uniref:glucose-1-phosphate cytidylyltransferase n=1 Tax=Magnetospirillum sp. 15-1 TaxID=1979370 RepID=UPI000BBC0098|nr:glucose-1-phosphate cytidylyltransferase [Magnetospirillum sp. 15-1]